MAFGEVGFSFVARLSRAACTLCASICNLMVQFASSCFQYSYALPSLYRQGKFARVGIYENDIATLFHAYHPELAPLFEELAQHLSDSDLASICEVVSEIKQRIERFNQSFGEGESS